MIASMAVSGYVFRLFVARSVVMLCVLAGVIQMLDLLATADDIMAGAGAGNASIWKYLTLRLPQLVTDFAPFAALLGSLITFGQLSQSSEVIVMRASGLSGLQIIVPFCLAGGIFTILLFAFNELVTVPSTKALSNWQDADYAMNQPVASDIRYDVWLSLPDELIHFDRARLIDDRLSANDVTIYGLRDGTGLDSILVADRAEFESGDWVLLNVTATDLSTLQERTFDSLPWAPPFTPERVLETQVVPEHLALADIPGVEAQLAAEGLSNPGLSTIAWSRWAAPAACVLMPLLGAIAGFGIPRRGAMLGRLAAGLMFGFAYFVVENLLLALGKLGAMPPPLAAFLPLMLFACLGLIVMTYTEDSGR